ncbi:MAG TPA: hypothetical protein VMF31_05585 [Solirubrobacterales bacterium]|nr:hypothetical protein [Solirubrobacterales bacterium]
MGRPRSKLGFVVRAILILAAALIAALFIILAVRCVSGFISPDSGAETGSFGYLLIGTMYLVIAGPFIALMMALGLPMISNNPKFRGADR